MVINLTSCKEKEYLNNPIALGYRDNIYYIINQDGTEYSLEEYDDVKPIFGDYLMVMKKNKWGFIKNTGEEATKLIYSTVCPMSENKAVVTLDNTTIIIDDKGDKIYTFDNNIISTSSFKDNYLVIEKDGLYGYIKCENNSCKVIIEPTYAYASSFSEGYAGVGTYVQDKLKYSFINEKGELMTSEYLFDYVDDFSNSFSKVGTINDSGTMKYNYIKFSDNTMTYLTCDNVIVEAEYATSFENNLAFIADYKKSSTSQTYKWFDYVDINGNKTYTAAIEDYAKKQPGNFFPHSPIYINNSIVFLNSYRTKGAWEILYNSIRYYADSTDTYQQFESINWQINSEDETIKKSMEKSNYSELVFLTSLKTPIEIGKFIYNNTLNTYICKSKTNENKCGMIYISSEPLVSTDEYCADEYQINAIYFIPVIYDEIFY